MTRGTTIGDLQALSRSDWLTGELHNDASISCAITKGTLALRLLARPSVDLPRAPGLRNWQSRRCASDLLYDYKSLGRHGAPPTPIV